MRSRLIFALVAMLALTGPAAARGGETLDRMLPDLRAAHPGRLSDAQPYTDAGGRTRYHIKWMTPDGRILYFDGDPSTGRFSRGGNDWRDQRYAPRGRDDDFDGGDERPPSGSRSRWNGDDGGPWDRGDGGWRERRTGGPDGDWRGGPDRGGEGGWRGEREPGGGREWRGAPRGAMPGHGAWGGPGFWHGGGGHWSGGGHWGGGGHGHRGH